MNLKIKATNKEVNKPSSKQAEWEKGSSKDKGKRKHCADCQEVTTAKSDLALPGADMDLNATVLVGYLWVALCLPYTKIREYLGTFFKLSVSTSGLSRHVIRVAGIMRDVPPFIGFSP